MRQSSSSPITIIGGGPAGIEAALTLDTYDQRAVLVDNQPEPGGQYFKSSPFKSAKSRGTAVLEKLSQSSVQVQTSSSVWGIYPDDKLDGWILGIQEGQQSRWLKAGTLILACGAYDKPIPFPGWTSPGVLTAGGALNLIKNQGLLPGKRVILSGRGPLLFSTAAQIKKHGADITAFCHPRIPWGRGLMQAWRMFGLWGRVQESLEILQHLLPAKIPVFWDWAIKRVEGNPDYQVTLTKIPASRNSTKDQDLVLTGDTIITSDGFLPNNRLGRLLGCSHEYQKDLGGWVPIRNQYFESTIPGLFIIGDMAGIRGAEAAGLEGKIAGHAVAHQLGVITQKQLRKRTRDLKLEHQRQEQFIQVLNTVFNMDSPRSKAAAEDTILCRCEDIRAEDIIQEVKKGHRTMTGIKQTLRCGMGNCQGAICEELIREMLQKNQPSSLELDDCEAWSVRAPIHPIPISHLNMVDPPGGKPNP